MDSFPLMPGNIDTIISNNHQPSEYQLLLSVAATIVFWAIILSVLRSFLRTELDLPKKR
ncbi:MULTISPECIES: hypothetical protein [Mucilaginibacter]|uniref:CcmD family protein n=1 Tax=Mucilaginibacter rubeus TaxID=2027860 RepID=A0ABX7U6D9_9SPHI|nr:MULTISPECIES: hypothetical protein [Mucilaginibacter]QTE41582.1 hypothetical protein J3L19_21885 [Mucilaginibacter rubeus]QTE48188.1 hypothetical protein J3L21_21885 [Mucilaginibacter rubeus]QTE60961.1 hypothetical protein J3L22_20320 [Mucilaginibacter rubeus]